MFGVRFLLTSVLATAVCAVSGSPMDFAKRGSSSGSRSPRFSSSGWSITAPSRPLEWGDLNILHTTDTHGWLRGHQSPSSPEPNYSGTYGEFYSFVTHMKDIAEEKNVDFLLVDTGDIHDGTGLTDGYPASGEGRHDFKQSIKQLPYDLLTIGNHELYVYNNTYNIYSDFAPYWRGRYLTSNVNITVPDPVDASKSINVPVGSRFRKFKTSLGRKVTSLGVMYDFTGNDDNTTMQTAADLVKEKWFAEAIKEEPDVFLIAGHIPAQEYTWPTIYNAVRSVHPETPILMFGAHEHIRDCLQFDNRSMVLASGRYMETIGWMSLKFDKKKHGKNVTFSRRYLDANKLTYEYHTGKNNHTFDTRKGKAIDVGLEELAQRFDLNYTFGTAPRDLTISRDDYPSNGSLLTACIEQSFPVALSVNNTRNATGIPTLYITNSGSQRFDIFKGPFTKNDQFTASPFTNEIQFLANISYGVAKQVVGTLNQVGGEVSKRDEVSGVERKKKRRGKYIDRLFERGDMDLRYREWLAEMYAREIKRAREYGLDRRAPSGNVTTMGYVTSDSCPGVGDDTPHTAMPFYDAPAYISSADSSSNAPPSGVTSDSTPIDIVFVDFIASDVLAVVNELQSEKTYTESDLGHYSDLLSNELWGVYAQEAWN